MEANPPTQAAIEEVQAQTNSGSNGIFPLLLPLRFQLPSMPFIPMPFLLHTLLFRATNGITKNAQQPSEESAPEKKQKPSKLMSIDALLASEDKSDGNNAEESDKPSGSSSDIRIEKEGTKPPALRKKSRVNFGLTAEESAQISATESVSNAAQGFACHRCGKVFSYEYYRDKHLKFTPCVDNGQRRFPCQQCSRSFEKRDRLRIHVLHVHERHRPHVCQLCQKAFSQSSSLNKHLRTHSGERPYQCPHCEKRFTASSILRTHSEWRGNNVQGKIHRDCSVRQHSGEKPFKCAQCGKSFASHAAHDSHIRRSHPC